MSLAEVERKSLLYKDLNEEIKEQHEKLLTNRQSSRKTGASQDEFQWEERLKDDDKIET